MSTTSAYISSTFHIMKSVIWLWDSIGTIHVTGKFSAKDNWSETLIPRKLASRLIRDKNSVNSTIGRKVLSELTEDPTYVNPTYPRFVVLKTINIIGTAAFCPSWAKIRLTRVRLIRGLLYIYIYIYIYIYTHTRGDWQDSGLRQRTLAVHVSLNLRAVQHVVWLHRMFEASNWASVFSDNKNNISHRTFIRYLGLKGSRPKEIHEHMVVILGEDAPSYMVKKWAAEFIRGNESLESDPVLNDQSPSPHRRPLPRFMTSSWQTDE